MKYIISNITITVSLNSILYKVYNFKYHNYYIKKIYFTIHLTITPVWCSQLFLWHFTHPRSKRKKFCRCHRLTASSNHALPMLQKLQEYTDHMHLNLITVWVQSSVYSSVSCFGPLRFGGNWAEMLLGWFGLGLGLEWVSLVRSGVYWFALGGGGMQCTWTMESDTNTCKATGERGMHKCLRVHVVPMFPSPMRACQVINPGWWWGITGEISLFFRSLDHCGYP